MTDKVQKLLEIADSETKLGNFKKAIAAYLRILEIPDINDQAKHLSYWGVGEIYLNSRKHDDAEFYLSKAIDLAPQESYYHYLLGCAYTYKNQIDKAIEHLEQAAKINGSIEIYWGQLGWVVGYNKDFDSGVEYLKKALSINPSHYPSLRDLCMLYTNNKKFDEALVCLAEAEKSDPSNEEIALLRNQIESFQKNFERLS